MHFGLLMQHHLHQLKIELADTFLSKKELKMEGALGGFPPGKKWHRLKSESNLKPYTQLRQRSSNWATKTRMENNKIHHNASSNWRILLNLPKTKLNLKENQDNHLCLRYCGLPRHRNRPLTIMANRLHRVSHSSMLCDVKMTERFSLIIWRTLFQTNLLVVGSMPLVGSSYQENNKPSGFTRS